MIAQADFQEELFCHEGARKWRLKSSSPFCPGWLKEIFGLEILPSYLINFQSVCHIAGCGIHAAGQLHEG